VGPGVGGQQRQAALILSLTPAPAANIVIPVSITYRPTSLLFDPDCGICVATAAWLARRVAPDRLRLLPLTLAPADAGVGELVKGRQLAQTIHAVTPDGRMLTGARAVLAAGRLVPGWRLLARLFDHPAGHALLEPLYRLVSRRRRRIGRMLGLDASCEVRS
jgi:predicted DCC family thiol-disulfide oxidoreductase YuxK